MEARGKLATHCSQAIEIVSSNLTASTKSGGSVFEPRAEHQYGAMDELVELPRFHRGVSGFNPR